MTNSWVQLKRPSNAITEPLNNLSCDVENPKYRFTTKMTNFCP